MNTIGDRTELRLKACDLIVQMLKKNTPFFEQTFADTPNWKDLSVGEILTTLYTKK